MTASTAPTQTAPKDFFQQNGYFPVRGLFSKSEVAEFSEHYTAMRDGRQLPNDEHNSFDLSDPLARYARIMHPHRWDEKSMAFLIDPRLDTFITEITGHSPIAVQTMVYFKPAGARGQALHQDNHYLRVRPSTCIAAWLALDECDMENGCLVVVPKTQDLPVMCLGKADPSKSFTNDLVVLPEGYEPVPILMQPGDVLFFNGSLVHGSEPNTTADRFRRSLIAHYAYGDAESISRYYFPAFNMKGEQLTIATTDDGGTCGSFVESEGGIQLKEIHQTDFAKAVH